MPGYSEEALSFGPFTLYRSNRLLFEGDRKIRLGDRTLDLLITLVERFGEVVSKQSLIASTWGSDGVEDATLRAHVALLRTVLGEGLNGERFIVNVTGRGYCFVASVRQKRRAPHHVTSSIEGVPFRHNLPETLTRVIGRDKVIATITKQLSQRRFVSIVGSAGMGKTTVAIATADQSIARYRDGVRFVDLSLILDPQLVPSALATALETVTSLEHAITNLVRSLSNKILLIVIDNCEHVADAVADIVVLLLKATPDIKILTTSREPLRAEGEWVHRLLPLELPPAHAVPTATEAMAYPAVRLFVERCIASVDSFDLSDRDAEVVCEICRRLDGMPLAIELAAARVQAFGVRGLMRAIDDSLTGLSNRQRTAFPRHRNLMALLDWSHQILPESEQIILRRLSVFRGRFTLESAQAVSVDEVVTAGKVVEGLASLVSKSLISTELREREVQYRLLETTRAYAYLKLKASGEVSSTHLLHAHRMCTLLEDGKNQESYLTRAEWMAAFAWLIDDVRSALDWAFSDGGSAGVGVRLTAAATPLCHQLSLQHEFCTRISFALKLVEKLQPSSPIIELHLNATLSTLIYQTEGPGPRMRLASKRVFEMSELAEIADLRSEALYVVWFCAFVSGDYEECLAFAHSLSAIARESSKASLSLVLDRSLAQSWHFAGNQALAVKLAERVLNHPAKIIRLSAVQPPAADRRVTMRVILARVYWLDGRVDQAIQLAKECMDLAATDVAYCMCLTLAMCACPFALWIDDREAARAFAGKLIEIAEEQSMRHWSRWGSNFMRLISARDFSDQSLQSIEPIELDMHDDDNKQRDLFGTLGVFNGDASVIERSERGIAGWCTAEIHRQHGEWLLRRSAADADAAENLFRKSQQLSIRQGALSWELRASMSLARLLANRGQRADARMTLEMTYSKFSEGFGTSDLMQARKLLDQLGSQ